MKEHTKGLLWGCIGSNILWLLLLLSIFLLCGDIEEAYPAFLGEFEQGQDITIWGQFNDVTGEQASPTHVTNTRCSLFDRLDASAPTASGAMIEIGAAEVGLFRYKYIGGADAQLATGECVARITGTVGGVKPAAIHTLFVVDSGKGPNKRSTLTTSDNIGINWADVGNPTTTLNLSGTTIKAVTDGVTVTTNNDKTGYTVSTVQDKTGYSLAGDQLEPIMTSLNIDHSMRSTRDASDSTVSTNVSTINTNTDGDGVGGIDADINTVNNTVNTINTNTDTLEASMSTVNRKQDEMKASIETVTTYVDILPTTAPVIWNDTQDADSIYSWMTTDGNVTQDAELDTTHSDLKNLMEGIQQTQATMYASLNTISVGITLIDNVTNRIIIAGALANTNIASVEAVYGSVVQKINSAGASIQTVFSCISTVRTEHSTIIDEIRKNR